MRSLELQVTGEGLNVESLLLIFRDFEPRRKSSSSVYFFKVDYSVADYIEFLDQNRMKMSGFEPYDVVFWDISDYTMQNNGELSPEVMKRLSEMNATYCWTVI